MLTVAERQFMDLYVREGFTHDYNGHANSISKAIGITYDHFATLWKYYKVAWETVGEWPDHLPPLPPDPNMPCPWETVTALETRIKELQNDS